MDLQNVNGRFQVDPAPSGLRLTQAFINTSAVLGVDTDLLADADSARTWYEGAVRLWAETDDVPRVFPTALHEEALAQLCGFRDRLRSALREDDHMGEFRVPVTISVTGRHINVVPDTADAAAWIRSAVGAELLLAQESNVLRRLKLCRRIDCEVAFYDQSKNNSRVWHNMAKCGTPQHVRAYRRRLRESEALRHDAE